MKKLIALMLAALLALSAISALAEVYTDKDTVKQVQQALNDAGFDCGTPDGAAGKKTVAAIEAYQAANGLEQTGAIDDALLISLGLMEGEAVELDYVIGEDSADYALTIESSDLPFAQLKWGQSPAEVLAAIGATGDVSGNFTARIAINGIDAPLPIAFHFVSGGLDSVTIIAKEGLRIAGKFMDVAEGAALHEFVNNFYQPEDASVRLRYVLDARVALKSPFTDGYVGYISRGDEYDLGVIFSKPVHFDEMPFRETSDFYITTSSIGEVVYFSDINRYGWFDTQYSLDSRYDRTGNMFSTRVMLTGSHLSSENYFPHFDLYYVYGGKVDPSNINKFQFTVDNVIYQFTPSSAGQGNVTQYRDYTQQFYITIGERNVAFMDALAATNKTVTLEITGDNGFLLRFDVSSKTIKTWLKDWEFFKSAGGNAPFFLRACGETPVVIR